MKELIIFYLENGFFTYIYCVLLSCLILGKDYLDNDVKSNMLLEWNFHEDGGKFIGHPSLQNHVTETISLISNFIRFERDKKYTKWDAPIYRAMPAMMIDIAYGCRIDSGYCLLQRCARHAVDPRAKESIQLQHGAFFIHKETNELSSKLKNSVPSSMKTDTYETEVAITAGGKLLACSCTCCSGASKNSKNKVACVHVLPVLHMLTFFLVL